MKNRLMDPLLNLGCFIEDGDETRKNLIGYVSYEGEIGSDLPREFHLDTQAKRLSLLYKSGMEEVLVSLTKDHIAVIEGILEQPGKNLSMLKMGLYRSDAEGNMVDPCYRVPTQVI